MVAPFAQGTSSENNVGDRVRTFPSVGYAFVVLVLFRDMEIDPDRDLYLSIDR